MRIGIVVHGPNIIDSGCALKIINLLKEMGDVRSRLGGTMGRTAVIDASLEDTIDISTKRLPSESIKLFLKENVDMIVLLNYGKSSVTGHTFGFKVFKNSFLLNSISRGNENQNFNSLKNKFKTDFIQIERPNEEDGSIIHWNGENKDFYLKLGKLLKLNPIEPDYIINKYFNNDHIFLSSKNKIKDFNIKIEDSKGKINANSKTDLENNQQIRTIYGVSPNENIFVNGIVIGKSKSKNLSLVAKNGKIIDIIGGVIKTHGIEKLGSVDINKAIVKTGLLRKSIPKPRIMDNENNENNGSDENKNDNILIKSKDKEYLTIAFLDHAAEDIYSLNDVDLVVTIGDDTTLVASDILYRFNIPVIGITDGDLDKVVEKGYMAKNSTIIELKSGFDDIVGKIILKDVFKSKNSIKVPIDDNIDKKLNDFKNEILKIVNNISVKYKIKE